MNMKHISILLFFLFCIQRILSQDNGCNCSSEEDFLNWQQKGLIGVEYTNPVNGYKGEEQYLQDWTNGEIYLNNGGFIPNVILRYDRYLDQLLWMRMSDYRKGVLNKDIINGFKLYKEWIIPESVYTKKRIELPWIDSTEVFLQVMVEGEISMYVYRKVKKEPVEFKLMDNTKYILESAGKVYAVPLRRKSLLEMPFIVKAEMKKVLRKYRIAVMNNEKGMADAIDLYNKRKFDL